MFSRIKLFLAVGSLFFISSIVTAQSQEKSGINLFKIERNKNANVVMYDIRLESDGKINAKNPIDSYWLLFAKDGRREEIGTFEKKAYGYKMESNRDGTYKLVLNAVKDNPVTVSVVNGVPKASTKINGEIAYLSKVYVFASNGFIPNVLYYTLTGTSAKNGKEITEKVENR
jgi:hypothetical protein